MNRQDELARRYRRRLALYPRAYRREHEEEMLAVLLECARPGQEFPRVVESLDLIWGALRMRLRLRQVYRGNIGSDALAAFSLLAPLLLAGPVLATLMLHLVHAPPAPGPHVRERFPMMSEMYYAAIAAERGVNLAMAGQLAVAIAVVLRRRRLALAVITVVLALWIIDARYGFRSLNTVGELLLTCYAMEATALIVSPGPRRGLQLLSWTSGTVLAAAAAALTVSWTLTMGLANGGAFTSAAAAEVNRKAVLALVILAAGVFLFSHLGRYVVMLFAGMLCPLVLNLGWLFFTIFVPTTTQAFTIKYLPPVLALCAVVAVAFRHRNRRFPDRPHGTTAIKGTRPT
jgi:hypothetical protein